jgi:uncharacterized protein YbjT (DUF2867 family)
MSSAYVAGATGYTGREVVRALLARGIATVAHVRADSPRLAALTGELTAEGAAVDATPWEEGALVATLRRVRPSLVFALLGTTRARGREEQRLTGHASTYESVDYGLSAMLLRAAVASGVRPRFVYLSAWGAGRPSRNAYYAARHKMETELRASGLEYVIARPGLITGPDRAEPRAGERAAAVALDGALGVLKSLGATKLHDRFASVTARQLAQALVSLALEARSASCVAEPEDLRLAMG